MMRTIRCWSVLALMLIAMKCGAQDGLVRNASFGEDWFVQVGLDMSLQNPYGYNFARVLPNGKSFGLDVALSKWFTPQVGVRGKFNWENALPLLENGHANWLAPFYQPGVNREKGGYVAIYGDVLLNLHNLFGTYRADRTWNTSLYPRVGVNYNFGVTKGSLLAGVGLLETYRLNDRWSVYADVAYMMSGSGFVGSEKVQGTGTGANSNGYFSLGLGAQVRLGKLKSGTGSTEAQDKGILMNGIWDNWFVQAGVDMSLLNPYGCDFGKVIPKGLTWGVNAAVGKWFSPEFGLRGRVQWENGLIENKSVEWLPPTDNPRQNYQEGGLAAVSLDAMLNVTNVIAGHDPQRRWHTTAYVRAGIISQFVEGSCSPLMGAGIQETYRLNQRLSLFGSAGYQVSTSEGMGYGLTGMKVSTGSNGYFDIDFGVVYDLGRNGFYRDVDSKRRAYAQPLEGHNWPRLMVNTMASMSVAYIGKTALKAVVHEERPDHSDNKAFPSGHAAMAFAAARSLDKEFRRESIWVPIVGYAAATAVGIERVATDRHHWHDVVAGAGLGIASAELTWWLSDKVFKNDNVAVGIAGNSVDLVVRIK